MCSQRATWALLGQALQGPRPCSRAKVTVLIRTAGSFSDSDGACCSGQLGTHPLPKFHIHKSGCYAASGDQGMEHWGMCVIFFIGHPWCCSWWERGANGWLRPPLWGGDLLRCWPHPLSTLMGKPEKNPNHLGNPPAGGSHLQDVCRVRAVQAEWLEL